jgi:ABC-type sugar transport system substrate-binding protein
MTLLKEFRTAHPDAFPPRCDGPGKGSLTNQTQEERMTRLLDNLTAKGYDVSIIRAAVESGDTATAHTLMQEFMTAHPDAFTARGDGPGKGHLEQQGRTQNTE